MRLARIISGLGIVAAILFSWLFALPLANRFRVYSNRDDYRREVFEVAGAEYDPSEGHGDYWLTGMVAGKEELMAPRVEPGVKISSSVDITSYYPSGTKIEVLYNPQETRTIMQGETLRVLHFKPGFWEEEKRLRHKLMWLVLLPVPLALAVFVTVRKLEARRAKGSAEEEQARVEPK